MKNRFWTTSKVTRVHVSCFIDHADIIIDNKLSLRISSLLTPISDRLSETFRGRRGASFVDQTDLEEHYLYATWYNLSRDVIINIRTGLHFLLFGLVLALCQHTKDFPDRFRLFFASTAKDWCEASLISIIIFSVFSKLLRL